MHASNMKSALVCALALGALSAAVPAQATVNPYDGNWHFSVTPYLWLPNINGSMDAKIPRVRTAAQNVIDDVRLSTEIGPNDYLSNLKFGVLVTGEARKGLWSVFTDVIYMDFGNQDSHIRNVTGPDGRRLTDLNRNTTTSLSSTLWTLAGGYTVVHDQTFNLDVLAGFRYVGIDTDLKWSVIGAHGFLDQSGRVSNTMEEWDGIVGVKGQVRFGDGRWFVPYYADIGTGSSNWTWQALVGLGYSFGWGDVSLSIRSLSYDFDKNNADLRMTGPALGVSFRW
jgi:hypothetical protein